MAKSDIHAYAQERERMVAYQIAARGVNSERVLEAMRQAPRHLFVSGDCLAEAYADHPLSIGGGQTISQPYIVALMTELAEVTPESRVLEIGTGSGYQTYLLATLAREVYTIEILSELQETAQRQLEALGLTNISYRVANGAEGWPQAAPFDAIVVTAAPLFTPPALKEQLAEGGRLVIPVGPHFDQSLLQIRRKGKHCEERNVLPVRFVPLIGAD
ncbi:MAG: protein-L-isoaspartate(D-aspartate) O-methyltransferase [Candidatus Sumerlaeota bacterium]|nr:protein-L-isoaspartate(D-aspartate) O-methyltransferase [Candidatus Sumerlaeota bacterium]